MKRIISFLISVLVAWIATARLSAAEHHRATRLGNPATRFAPPLHTVEDLRSRFRDNGLRPDIAEILRQWGWSGRLEDLIQAALTAEVREAPIPVGATMPFMSSREAGRPICLRNVLWAGKEPAPAYAFNFKSNGRLYRCVTPKACSNFFVEDLGPEPIPALALECSMPRQAFPGRPVDLCLIVKNPGTGIVPQGAVRLPVPQNARLVEAGPGASVSISEIVWQFSTLMPRAEKRFCARFISTEPAIIAVHATATAANLKPAQSSCSAQVIGIPAILIDAIDLEDPIQVGGQVTYEVKVTNQGSSEATNVRLGFNLPPNELFVSGGGATPISNTAKGIETDPLPVLAPKSVATWRVVVKAQEPGDVRFKIQLTSDQFQKPINEEESTLLY